MTDDKIEVIKRFLKNETAIPEEKWDNIIGNDFEKIFYEIQKGNDEFAEFIISNDGQKKYGEEFKDSFGITHKLLPGLLDTDLHLRTHPLFDERKPFPTLFDFPIMSETDFKMPDRNREDIQYKNKKE